ncbi:hypothetical protein EV668_3173 [Enterovirga rhinocerotis]|uniref:Uncharacterized protein n=1 Tax=Enterovirga rhinocerotis TaxID=1339210 RepID=A0A4R7BZW7_9HYPH|nr:hypothetical protein EV668_3173 [Enterovirga rhinocerotis]
MQSRPDVPKLPLWQRCSLAFWRAMPSPIRIWRGRTLLRRATSCAALALEIAPELAADHPADNPHH